MLDCWFSGQAIVNKSIDKEAKEIIFALCFKNVSKSFVG
ncbi:hypothetical protein MICA_2452 [Micavibrio aeruginosavorus ARL-13]|uniref:Uncharacterized protein n=1 Tax=Micavibrio aeruginosavorus (strain ARL-13) TaxID=856793 RepID=G2KNV8_MICAA|nr:hypothetical protein MICA_2452 [Micavibrio aeruginosavorus ARL-13]